jgi:hypothetical protein
LLGACYREYRIGERLLTGHAEDDAKGSMVAARRAGLDVTFRTFEERLAKTV